MPAPLFLVGFMAAGKTSVGRAIAAASGRRFVDLDDAIKLGPGETVAGLVGKDEPEFRRRESAALQELIEGARTEGGVVIATGGGAAVHRDNMARMRAAGFVVALGVDVDVARSRAVGGTERPLLASAAELAARRAPTYRRAHVVIETSGRTLDEVRALVADAESAWQRLPFSHRDATLLALDAGRTYPIAVHERAVEGDLVRSYLEGATKIAVITDHEVARYWQSSALAAFAGLPGRPEVIAIDPGEASKALATFGRVCEELIARGLDRGSALVALGGGVVGDITGFVAATLFRGIPFIQLPTTIVAMTDAAIGGKTAIDLAAGKNLVGAFWQPRLVACGLETLRTLPARERRAGFGELWKYALLDGAELWQLVDACASWAAGDDARELPLPLRDVIARSIAYKAAIVSRDERERTGYRALLNLGHTVGHAIESATGLHHGEAVGLGLVAACRVSAAVVGARASLEGEVTAALRRTGLPAELDPHLTDDVLGRFGVDKKRTGDRLRFIAVREVGACVPVEIPVTELRRILRPVPAP